MLLRILAASHALASEFVQGLAKTRGPFKLDGACHGNQQSMSGKVEMGPSIVRGQNATMAVQVMLR